MDALIHIICASSAAPDISEHDALKYLNQTRSANRKHDVSGMMIYVGGCFLQVLEGRAAMIDAVCSITFRDRRQMRLLLREPIAEREFPDWIMGFEAIEPSEACRLLEVPMSVGSAEQLKGIDPASAKALLSIVGRRRWQSDRSGMYRAIRLTAGN